jgi:hypothetical protein
VIDVPAIPVEDLLIAIKGFQKIQDGRPPGHPDIQVVT